MSERKIKPGTYGLVFVALIVLTLLTVWLSTVDLGTLHVPVGLAIATTKGILIALFFMHMLHTSRLNWMVASATLFFLAILLSFTMADYLTRHWPTAPPPATTQSPAKAATARS